MEITRTSSLTGKENTMDLDVTEQQIYDHRNGVKAQDAYPNLTAPEREFLISGATPDEWNEYFGVPNDDEEE